MLSDDDPGRYSGSSDLNSDPIVRGQDKELLNSSELVGYKC